MRSPRKLWLTGFLFLVLLLISIGGITRLTRSGLSIAEWKPITGAIPPLTDSDWQLEFERYQQTPEYKQINFHFGIAEYRKIFMWEYLHRLLGRIVFLFAMIPGLWLWKKRSVDGRQVFLLTGLVALQGLFGWLMVKSGLNREPHVSPYLLAVHFFGALSVLGAAYFPLCRMKGPLELSMTPRGRGLFLSLGAALGLQIFYGCLTSGLKAGYLFNTYPLMNGQILPPMGLSMKPLWINLVENPASVQWIHRWLGASVFVLVVLVYLEVGRSAQPDAKRAVLQLVGITAVQLLLGILTLVLVIPTSLAATHQLVAALVFLAYLNIAFRNSRRRSISTPKKQSGGKTP